MNLQPKHNKDYKQLLDELKLDILLVSTLYGYSVILLYWIFIYCV